MRRGGNAVDGAVAAALSIVAIRRRVPEDRSELLVTAVRTAAETLSRKLAVVRS